MIRLLPVLGATLAISLGLSPAALADRPITVVDTINTRRVLDVAAGRDWAPFRSSRETARGVLLSPSGDRYVLLLVRGDVERNGNWLEVVSGSAASVEAARAPRVVARLFMSSLAEIHGMGTAGLTLAASFNNVSWLDDHRIALLWGDERNVTQVFTIDLRSGEVAQMTRSATHVVAYALSPRGDLAYAARLPRSRAQSERLLREGFLIDTDSVLGILDGDVDGYSATDTAHNADLFVRPAGRSEAHKVEIPGTPHLLYSPTVIAFSPDGARLAFAAAPSRIPTAWSDYTDRFLVRNLADARRFGPKSLFARVIFQLHVVETGDRLARTLVDAPLSNFAQLAWSPDGRSVAVAPTYPEAVAGDAPGLAGRAALVIDVAARQATRLPAQEPLPPLNGVDWSPDGTITLRTPSGNRAFSFGEKWTAVTPPEPPRDLARGNVRLELKQDINTPPRLYALDAAGRAEMVFDLNPRLENDFRLGRAEPYAWTDATGRKWKGRLNYPPGDAGGSALPLVIQTHGATPDGEYSLSGKRGPGLGPGVSAYAGQVLASHGILVLTMQDLSGDPVLGTPAEPVAYREGYDSAIDELARAGRVDPARVGIIGYSRTGWHVEQALIHSRHRFAAAVVVEKTEPGYLWAHVAGLSEEYILDVGAKPFGEGLKTWMERSAAANADKIRTPVLFLLHSGGLSSVLNHWELYSRLRFLGKPVEYRVSPDILRANHGLQNPGQLRAMQESAVEWFAFWLRGVETADPAKRPQNDRWRSLRQRRTGD